MFVGYIYPNRTVEIYKEVQAAILADPQSFDMKGWTGTHKCIGGRLAEALGRLSSTPYQIAKELNLEFDRFYRTAELSEWPADFRMKYLAAEKAGDRDAMAQIAVARIEHFLKTGE